MIIIGAAGLIAGALLAWRYSAFALLPAVFVAPAATLLIEILVGHKLVYGLQAAFYVALALQIGFLAGAIGRRLADVARLERPAGAPFFRRSRVR